MWDDFSRREKILLLLLVLFLVAGVVWKIAPSALMPAGRDGRTGGLIEEGDPLSLEKPAETEQEAITVHLVGAVKNPGIYHLPAGSRVYQLLEAAGGPAKKADLESVNLARPLYDGEQVAIGRPGEVVTAALASPGKKINVNKASLEELQTLSSIGQVRAQRIIEHREKYGPFTDINEIMDVSGIGEGIFNQIKDQITIY